MIIVVATGDCKNNTLSFTIIVSIFNHEAKIVALSYQHGNKDLARAQQMTHPNIVKCHWGG